MAAVFSSLSPRERVLVVLAMLVGALMLVYLYAWEPKTRQLDNLRDIQVPASEQTLAWVRQALDQAKNRPGASAEKIIEGPLLTVIEQTAQKAGVRDAIRRIQPNQSRAVKIWMEEVSFDAWLRWLELLRSQNVFVDRASIAKSSPGMTTIRVTLARR